MLAASAWFGLIALLTGCSTEPIRLDCEGDVELVSHADRDALFGVPAGDVVGVMVAFHGLGEDACNWVDKVEEGRFVAAAMERQMAWVAPDGADGAWDVELDNAEVASVDAVLAALEEDGRLPPNLPTLAVGHSNGGAFAQIWSVGSGRDIVAALSANGWGTAALGAEMPLPPTLFVTAENDTVVRPSLVVDAAVEAESRGHEVQVVVHQRIRVPNDRFARIEGINEEDSALLLAAFGAAGLLDDGRIATNPRTDSAYSEAVPEDLQPLLRHIGDQLHVLYAEHRFSSEDTAATFDLYDAALERRR